MTNPAAGGKRRRWTVDRGPRQAQRPAVVRVEYDPAKDVANRAKHGLTLSLGADVVSSAVTTIVDARRDYGETRLIAFGYAGGRLLACVYTVRGDVVRIISLRRASDREVKRYG